MRSPLIYTAAGLLILIFPFSLSFGMVNFFGDSFHVVIALDSDPNALTDMILGTIFFGSVPISVALAFFTLGYVKPAGVQTSSNVRLFLSIPGLFCIGWGALNLRNAYLGYLSATGERHVHDIGAILLTVHLVYGSVGILWLLSGLLLIVTSSRGRQAQDASTPKQ